jgi:hypothetical protein
MAVRSKLWRISMNPTGHQPSSFRAWSKDSWPFVVMMTAVITLLMKHATLTALIRLRMTDGASRLRVGEGRVADDK